MKKLMIALLCLSLFACKKTETVVEKPAPEAKKETIDTNQYEGFPDIQVEKLIKSAEKLMHPAGYVFALEILDEVLLKDPKNKKALLYKSILGPFTYFKGIYSKLLPYLKQNLPHVYDQYIEKANSLAEGGFRDFLFAEAQPFQSEEDISQFLANFITKLENSRQFFIKNKNLVTTIQLSEVTDTKYYFENCSVKKLSPGVYQSPPCVGVVSKKYDVNRGDMELLKVITSGLQVYLTLATSYTVDGLAKVDVKSHNGEFKSKLEQLMYISSLQTIGKLKKDNQLNMVRTLGADIITSLKWAQKLEGVLCEFGKGNPKNRPDNLFSEGYCLDGLTKIEPYRTPDLILAMLDQSVQSIKIDPIEVDVNLHPESENDDFKMSHPNYRTHMEYNQAQAHWDEYFLKSTVVDPFKPFDNMPTDLRVFIPKYNECGWPVSIDDPTFNGLFPAGDGLEIISRGQSEEVNGCTPSRYYTRIAPKDVREVIAYDYFMDTFKNNLKLNKDYLQVSENIYRFRIYPERDSDQIQSDGNPSGGDGEIKFEPLTSGNSVDINLDDYQQLVSGYWIQNYKPFHEYSWTRTLMSFGSEDFKWVFSQWWTGNKIGSDYYELAKVIAYHTYLNNHSFVAHPENPRIDYSRFYKWIDSHYREFPMGTDSKPFHFEMIEEKGHE